MRIGAVRAIPQRQAGPPPNLNGKLVAEGDSITEGFGATAWPTLLAAQAPLLQIVNVAATGHSFSLQITDDGPIEVDPEFNPSKPWNVASILAGVNDAAQGSSAATIYSAYGDWCSDRRAAGFLVLGFNLTWVDPGQWGFTATVNSLNALLNAGHSFCDAYIDARTLLGDSTSHPTWWQSDGLHPTTLGEQQLANAAYAAIAGMVA